MMETPPRRVRSSAQPNNQSQTPATLSASQERMSDRASIAAHVENMRASQAKVAVEMVGVDMDSYSRVARRVGIVRFEATEFDQMQLSQRGAFKRSSTGQMQFRELLSVASLEWFEQTHAKRQYGFS